MSAEAAFRVRVLTEVLKLITDRTIVVDGERLVIKTGMSPSAAGPLPWLGGEPPVPQSSEEHEIIARFDTVSADSTEQLPITYGWEVSLVET